ncbi:uncharacterized protein B0H18DRAFT_1121817 [Fomitopsis serialis]|uniref:uncharacterized protein n=1 Tax=Fomitopsis serialis TaxID=139415 RepID=UPI002007244B|nr:uncharacterized protein B0H18DRAFT_1121817 [Neoantrodia serialis]KAH9920584.1 hypothetical protein B0H18DRAFT_1121817 [Neoantrodia serialis]
MNAILAKVLEDIKTNLMIPKTLQTLAEANGNPAAAGALDNFVVGLSVSALMIGLQELLKADVAEAYGLTDAMSAYCEIVAPPGAEEVDIVTNVIKGTTMVGDGQNSTPDYLPRMPVSGGEHIGNVRADARIPGDTKSVAWEGAVNQTVNDLPAGITTPEAMLEELRANQACMDDIIKDQLQASKDQLRRVSQHLELEKLRDKVTVRAEQINRVHLPRFPLPAKLCPDEMPASMPNNMMKWLQQLGKAMKTMDIYIQAELNFWHAAARANAAELEAWQRGETPTAPAAVSYFRVIESAFK